MSAPAALIDTNVIIALLVEEHEHHAASFALFDSPGRGVLAVAAHSIAEAFATLTRGGPAAPFQRHPDQVMAALDSLVAATRLVGLAPMQTLAAVRAFASSGRAGPLLHDFLIGEAARAAGIATILTWNLRHFRPLFPDLAVRTPIQALTA